MLFHLRLKLPDKLGHRRHHLCHPLVGRLGVLREDRQEGGEDGGGFGGAGLLFFNEAGTEGGSSQQGNGDGTITLAYNGENISDDIIGGLGEYVWTRNGDRLETLMI